MANSSTEAYDDFIAKVRTCKQTIAEIIGSMTTAADLMKRSSEDSDEMSAKAQELLKKLSDRDRVLIEKLTKLEADATANRQKIYKLHLSISKGPSI